MCRPSGSKVQLVELVPGVPLGSVGPRSQLQYSAAVQFAEHGIACYETGEHASSLEFFRAALQIMLTLLQPNVTSDTDSTNSGEGMVSESFDDGDVESLLVQSPLVDDVWLSVVVLYYMGLTYGKMGELVKSLLFFQMALSLITDAAPSGDSFAMVSTLVRQNIETLRSFLQSSEDTSGARNGSFVQEVSDV